MAKATINLEAYNGIDETGIYSSIFVGDGDDDPIEVRTSWDEIVKAELEMHSIPLGGPIVVSKFSDGAADIIRMANAIYALAERIEAIVHDNPIFLRDEWEKEQDAPRENFQVDYNGYIQYLMEKCDD